jgi:hypothetical protein
MALKFVSSMPQDEGFAMNDMHENSCVSKGYFSRGSVDILGK